MAVGVGTVEATDRAVSGIITSVMESNTCNYCRAVDGMMVKPGDGNPRPPYHASCQCDVFWLRGSTQLRDDEGNRVSAAEMSDLPENQFIEPTDPEILKLRGFDPPDIGFDGIVAKAKRQLRERIRSLYQAAGREGEIPGYLDDWNVVELRKHADGLAERMIAAPVPKTPPPITVTAPQKPIEYKELRRKAEIVEFLKDKLGIAEVRIGSATLSTLNRVARTMTEARNRGVFLPAIVTCEPETARRVVKNAVATYSSFSDAMRVAPHSPWARHPKLLCDSAYKSHWWSTSHEAQPIRHELGHRTHWMNVKGTSLQRHYTSTARLVGEDYMTAMKVSRYATANPAEFVAETWTGLFDGKVYHESVMSLYRRLGGVIP